MGAEVIAGDSIIPYGLALGLPASVAKYLTAMHLLVMTLTYLVGAFLIPKYISQETCLSMSSIWGLCATAIIVVMGGTVSLYCLVGLGAANAMAWPTIWPLTLKGTGCHAKRVSAMLMLSVTGGAFMPPIYGFIVDCFVAERAKSGVPKHVSEAFGQQFSYSMLFLSYGAMLAFARYGSQLKRRAPRRDGVVSPA
eukprot:Selendium_serpulae@DN4396_c0_g1_i1.p2